MQRLEVSCVVRHIYMSLDAKGLTYIINHINTWVIKIYVTVYLTGVNLLVRHISEKRVRGRDVELIEIITCNK